MLLGLKCRRVGDMNVIAFSVFVSFKPVFKALKIAFTKVNFDNGHTPLLYRPKVFFSGK